MSSHHSFRVSPPLEMLVNPLFHEVLCKVWYLIVLNDTSCSGMLVFLPCGYVPLAAMAFLGGDGLCAFGCVPQPLSPRVCPLKLWWWGEKGGSWVGGGEGGEGEKRSRRRGKRGEELGGCLSRQGQSVMLSNSCFLPFPVELTVVMKMF